MYLIKSKFKHLRQLYLLPLAIALVGCQTSLTDFESSNSQISRLNTQLVLNQAILEQANKQENTVWKIKADNLIYSEDKKTATLNKVVGNLWQNDKIILKISANKGEVRDNGNIIILKEQVVASDPRNQGVMESSLVEWRPQENLLLIKENLNGFHSNLEVTAREGKYFTDVESLEIEEDVVATADRPALQLKSDRLKWNIPQAKIISPGAVEIVRFDDNQTVTDRLVGDRAQFDLATNTATLENNIELISTRPNIQAASESLTWNYQQRVGKTERPIQILDRERQISLTGNKGEVNLQQQIAKLTDGVRGINQLKASELYARQLTWKIETEEVEARGNVIYEQADPQARLTGEKAVGTLGNNNIVVTGDGKKQVTSVIDN